MKNIAYLGFWFALMLAGAAFGLTMEERGRLIDQLSSEDASERAKASQELANEAEGDLKGVLQQVLDVMRASSDPEVDRQTKEVIRAIYRRHKLGIGDVDCGWKLGWFLHHNGKDLRSFPLVLEVEEGGPAERAGLEPGDAIFRANGKWLRSKNSRNEFLEQVARMKPGEELTMTIQRSGAQGAYQIYSKGKKKEFVLEPEIRGPGGAAPEVSDDEVRRWLAETLE